MVTRSDDTWTRDNGCFWSTSRERERALRSCRVEEETGGDSRRPSWSLGLLRLHLKYYTERALKRLMNPEPYYRYPRIESSYRTCDSLAD